MKIYIDNCCYGRPYDDRTQEKIGMEADAVMAAIELCKLSEITIVGSPALIVEIGKIEADDIRKKVREFYDNTVTEFISLSSDIVLRARDFMAIPMKKYDSYHLAFAAAARADFLLTTDKKFINKAARTDTAVKVVNPINFLPEAERWAQ
jgi:predicted nucleic acid-binding protein